LIKRVQQIADRIDAVHVSNLDAIEFLNNYKNLISSRALIYLDPPYYNKGLKVFPSFFLMNSPK